MIVQCEQCKAKFNVADDKISAKGTSVRCSKCKTVFKVFKETANAAATSASAPPPMPHVESETLPTPEPSVPAIPVDDVANIPAPQIPSLLPEEVDISGDSEELFGGMEGDLSPPSADEIGFQAAISKPAGEVKGFAVPEQPATMEFKTPVPAAKAFGNPIDPLDSVDPMQGALQSVAASLDQSGTHNIPASQGSGSVQLGKPIALRTVSRASALGLPTDQAPSLSKSNRVAAALQHMLMCGLLLAVLLSAMAMRGVHVWRHQELANFFNYGFTNKKAGPLILQDYQLTTIQRVRDATPLVMVSGILYNSGKKPILPPKLQLFLSDRQGNEQLTADLPCCLEVPITSLRETDNAVDLQALYTGNLNTKPIATGEQRHFQLIVMPKNMPINYKVSLLGDN